MIKNKFTEFTISPHNSLNKNSLIIISSVIILIFIIASIIWLKIDAWPITIFMGLEYIFFCVLLFWFYKKRNVRESIKINSNNISYKFYNNKKLKKNVNFTTYWAKIKFFKKDNKSKLTIRQSDKELEIGTFLSTKPKEDLYNKLNLHFKK